MNWTENIPEGEHEQFEGYAAELREFQRTRSKGRENFRALHTKPHVGAVGSLTVPALPAELRVGPFAEPHAWPLYARFSNGQPGYHGDKAPDIRGFAVKLVGVPGKKLIPGLEDAPTQDFLMIQTPAISVRDPHEFMHLVRASKGSPLMLVPRMIRRVGFARTFRILKGFLGAPKVRSFATASFYTAAPLRFGDTAAKLALFPEASDDVRAVGNEGLRADLGARLAAGPLAWTLNAQLFVDEATTPIEDASALWPEDKSPWRPLGRLELPRQDVTSPAGEAVQTLVEQLSFDPWHAHVELRPVGAVMRARSAAYRESAVERRAAPEPHSVLPPG